MILPGTIFVLGFLDDSSVVVVAVADDVEEEEEEVEEEEEGTFERLADDVGLAFAGSDAAEVWIRVSSSTMITAEPFRVYPLASNLFMYSGTALGGEHICTFGDVAHRP